MATSILSFILAVIWGLVLGRRLRGTAPPSQPQFATVRLFAFYSALPAASFITVPVSAAIGGWSVLNTTAGTAFGIPSFLPWPFSTILGFCLAVVVVTVTGKVLLTTGLCRVILLRKYGNNF